MLSNWNLQPKLVEAMQGLQRNYLSTFVNKGEGECPLLSFSQMYKVNQNILTTYASGAYMKLQEVGKIKKDDKEVWQKSYLALGYLGLSLSQMFYAYNIHTGDFALYTASLGVLSGLVKSNYIQPKKGKTMADIVADFRKDFDLKDGNCTGIMNFIKTNGEKTMKVIRLTPVRVSGNVMFEATTAKSFNVQEMAIFPLDVYNYTKSMLVEIMRKAILLVKEDNKTLAVTKNTDVLRKIYGEERAFELDKKSTALISNKTSEFYAPCLGKSKFSFGMYNIQFERVNAMKIITLQDAQKMGLLEDVNVDLMDIREHFQQQMTGKSREDILKVMGLLGHDVEKAKTDNEYYANALNYMLNKEFDDKIWDAMKKEPAMLDKEGYLKKTQAKGREYTRIENIPDAMGLKQMFKSGKYVATVKVVSGSSKADKRPKLKKMYLTNNEEALQKALGANYYGRYESSGNRLRAAKQAIEDGNFDISSANVVLETYGVKDTVQENITGEWNVDNVKAGLDAALNAMGEAPNKGNDTITVRNFKATYSEEKQYSPDFYCSIDPKNIVELLKIEEK
jgi:hypothetical protein